MSKKYKNQICVYCNKRESETADHAFPRNFFLDHERQNLIKVPSCNECNNEKSKMEHYLASVLPFGGRHASSEKQLSEQVPKRLERNLKLRRELFEGMHRTSTGELAIPFSGEKYVAYWEYVVRALVFSHFGAYIDENNFVYAMTPNQEGEQFFRDKLLSLNAGEQVSEMIGNGTITYIGKQSASNPQLSVWEFSVYNGLKLTDESYSDSNEFSQRVMAITAPKSMESRLMRTFEGTRHNN